MEYTFIIASDHPALPGHFPGNPIVPGVVLLDAVAEALQQLHTGTKVTGLPNAKFLLPLRPDQACTVRFTPGRDSTIQFECTTRDGIVASGSFKIEGGR